jgi:hypothetical protein
VWLLLLIWLALVTNSKASLLLMVRMLLQILTDALRSETAAVKGGLLFRVSVFVQGPSLLRHHYRPAVILRVTIYISTQSVGRQPAALRAIACLNSFCRMLSIPMGNDSGGDTASPHTACLPALREMHALSPFIHDLICLNGGIDDPTAS